MNNDRDLTKDEKIWVTRLLKCMNSMPNSLEISVLCNGSINIMNAGTMINHLKNVGDFDNPPTLTWIRPNTAARIDGRDSQL